MIVAVHQPNYVPYLGFYHKMAHADVFVLYDTAQFSKKEFHNRNRIKTPTGTQWLTVPVESPGFRPIKDVLIARAVPWWEKHLKALEANYSRAPFYDVYAAELARILSRGWNRLADLNAQLIRMFARWLGIETQLVRSSDLAPVPSDDPTDKLIHFTEACRGSIYLSGAGGRAYLQQNRFVKVGLEFDEYLPRVYPQMFGEFVPNLSAIDALLNCGESARELLF